MRRSLPRRLLVLLLVLSGLLAAGCTVNPVTGKSQLDLMGEAQEIEMGASLYGQAIQGSLGPLDDNAAQAVVSRAGEAVAAVGHRPGLPYRFTAVNDPEINAFALPGGKICITRGLLSRLESEDGLAAVLGHEVGHVTARHAVAAYNRQLLAMAIIVGGGIAMEAGEVKHRELITLGAVVGAQLALAHYSREQERQCDELGLDYALKAGYSPAGMVETQRVLLSLHDREPGLVTRLFASHPMSRERLATAEQRVAALPAELRKRPLRVEPYRLAARHVLAERPAWDLAREGMGLLGEDKDKQAEGKLAEAVQLAPKAGVLRTLHALGLGELKRTEPALSEAREGARLAPGVFITQLVGGELLLKGSPQEALGRLDRAEELLPGVAQVSLLRGKALEALGRRSDAVGAYREAVERDPGGEVGAAAAQRLQALGAV
ncbi:MAG: M48 family metalloprotease [Acidobacteriota bacterium]